MSRALPVRVALSALWMVARIVTSGSAHADPAASPGPVVPTMTLGETLAFAHEHQPSIRAARARIEAARADADVPRSEWKPSIGATAQIVAATSNNTTASYFSVGALDLPRIGGSRVVSPGTWKPYPSTLVGVGVTQEVFDFGRIAARAAAADALVDAARVRAEAERLDVDFSVEEAYFAVLAAKGVVRASEDAFARATAHRDLAKAGVASGMRPPIELTRAEADLARFDIARARAHAGETIAQAVLAAEIGSPEPRVDVAGPPTAASEVPSLVEAMRLAPAHDPRVQEALVRVTAQEATTRAIGAELRPNVFLSGTLSGRAGGAAPSGNGEPAAGDGYVPGVANWDVGLVLEWPIFDGIVAARREASRARESLRREEAEQVREEERAALTRAYVDYDVARSALPGFERAVAAARANYEQADARFKAGLGTSIELADAETLRTEAEIRLSLGQFDLARARAAIGRALAEGL